jgi:hypothetical protein
MKELELRVAALELLLLERLALDEPGKLLQLETNIGAAVKRPIDADERAIRQTALDVLDAARRRFDEFEGARCSPNKCKPRHGTAPA